MLHSSGDNKDNRDSSVAVVRYQIFSISELKSSSEERLSARAIISARRLSGRLLNLTIAGRFSEKATPSPSGIPVPQISDGML